MFRLLLSSNSSDLIKIFGRPSIFPKIHDVKIKILSRRLLNRFWKKCFFLKMMSSTFQESELERLAASLSVSASRLKLTVFRKIHFHISTYDPSCTVHPKSANRPPSTLWPLLYRPPQVGEPSTVHPKIPPIPSTPNRRTVHHPPSSPFQSSPSTSGNWCFSKISPATLLLFR